MAEQKQTKPISGWLVLYSFTLLSLWVFLLTYYEHEWIEYRLHGCQCPKTYEADGSPFFTIRCKGHPMYPKLCPKWIQDRWEPMPTIPMN